MRDMVSQLVELEVSSTDSSAAIRYGECRSGPLLICRNQPDSCGRAPSRAGAHIVVAGVDATHGRKQMLSKLIVASTLAALVSGIGGTAHAQTGDYRTYFTFSTPVTLPGVTLPAGRYLFRLADPNSSRKVISVLSADGKTPLAMLHTIPNQLPRGATKT